MPEKQFYSTGEVSKILGIRSLHVSRIYERGFMPPATRVGPHRIIPAADLDALREAAKAAGYLK
jgi:excisionase family DNA binding protein